MFTPVYPKQMPVKRLIPLFLISMNLLCRAQTDKYIPFPSQMVSFGSAVNIRADYYFYTAFRAEINGDIVFNGIHYYPYYLAEKYPDNPYLQHNPNMSGPYNILAGGIRNDITAKKVYLYSLSTNSEELLYDFDLHVGDTLFKNRGYGFFRSIQSSAPVTQNHDTVWVSRIDSVLTPHDGLYHRRFNFTARYNFNSKYYTITSDTVYIEKDLFRVKINPLIEGVGMPNGPISYTDSFENIWEQYLYCMTINKKTFHHENISFPFMDDAYCYSIIDDIQDIETDNISLYPNPSDGKFKLLTNGLQHSSLEITDLFGTRILKSTVEAGETEIDLSSKASGIYFLRIYKAPGKIITRKIIVN